MEQESARGGKTAVVILVVVIIVLAALFGYYYVQSTNTVSSLNQAIAQKDAQISALSSTIESNIARIANLSAQVDSLQARVDADEAKIVSLTSGYASANATIASLNAEVSSLNAQITTLQTQIAELQEITGLARVTVELSSTQFSTNGSTPVVTFTADYAGYVIVTVTAATDFANTGIEVNNTFASNVNSPYYFGIIIPGEGFFYAFSGVPDALVFPILPGTVNVYLQTADLTTQTATLSVDYYA